MVALGPSMGSKADSQEGWITQRDILRVIQMAKTNVFYERIVKEDCSGCSEG
jgi:hypothetical protein